ncbi:MAG: FG-GAP-like repeat-containing protein [Rhodothermales bacterium]
MKSMFFRGFVVALIALLFPRGGWAQDKEKEATIPISMLLSQQAAEPPSASAALAPTLDATYVQTFMPSRVFDATSLNGTRQQSGRWRVQDGEYIGLVGPGGSALLLLDGSSQDLAVAASFRCGPGCEPGIVIHAQTEGDRTSAVLYSFGEGKVGGHQIVLDPSGKLVERSGIEPSPSPYPMSMLDFRAEYPGLGLLYPGQLGGRQGIEPLKLDNSWNRAEIHSVGTSLRGLLNGAGTMEAGVTAAARTAHGQVGLFVSGPPGTEIRFRGVGVKPMDVKNAQPVEVTSPRFRKQQLDAMFYSEAITAADVNLDGNMDVIAGPNIFMGPEFTTRHELFVPKTYSPTSYPDPLLASAGDFTGDGYPDILYTGEPGRPGFLYVNPGKGDVHRWEKYMVIPSVDNEVAFADDIDGDGQLEYVYTDGGFIGYAEPGPDPTKMWTFHPVTEKGPWGAMYAHGLGTGDVDGDGRKDIIQAYGWWQQPATPNGQPWTYHPETFGRWGSQQGGGGGARAYAYDVNGDGLNDIVTSLEGHGFGLAWFEQKRDAAGTISFTQHMIMDDFAHPNNGVVFAALHALAVADIDGDGLQDIVTGKRWWAHFGENPTDPDAFGAPVVYWFRLVRENGQARFVPELINNNSGVGTDMVTADLNNDGLPDVLTATRRGTNVFISKR